MKSAGRRDRRSPLAKTWIAQATGADKNQGALDPKIDQLREAWTAAKPGKDKLTAITALAQVLDERVKLMHQVDLRHPRGRQGRLPDHDPQCDVRQPGVLESLGMAEPEEPQRAAPTSMTL